MTSCCGYQGFSGQAPPPIQEGAQARWPATAISPFSSAFCRLAKAKAGDAPRIPWVAEAPRDPY